MPTYDYVCGACAHAFEQFQTMSAKKLRRCPKCKKPALERLVGTGAGLIFKGTGFYITDYRKPDAAGDSSPPPSAEKPGQGDKQGPKESPSKPASDGKSTATGSPAPATPSAKPAASAPPAKPAEATRADRTGPSKGR